MKVYPVFLKFFLLITLCLSSLHIFAQSSKSLHIAKIRGIIQTKAIGCNLKGIKCSVYFNNAEKTLDIYNIQIPLNEVKVSYEYIQSTEFKYWVHFTCREGFCMRGRSNEEMQRVSLPFRNKQDCYQLIEAIGNLKDTF